MRNLWRMLGQVYAGYQAARFVRDRIDHDLIERWERFGLRCVQSIYGRQSVYIRSHHIIIIFSSRLSRSPLHPEDRYR